MTNQQTVLVISGIAILSFILPPEQHDFEQPLISITAQTLKEAGKDKILDKKEQHDLFEKLNKKVYDLKIKYNCESVSVKEIEQFTTFSKVLGSYEYEPRRLNDATYTYIISYKINGIKINDNEETVIKESISKIASTLAELCK